MMTMQLYAYQISNNSIDANNVNKKPMVVDNDFNDANKLLKWWQITLGLE
jgi:hypothetical protein